MTSLPENWESDYDGNRWFYRYRPTGIIQYTFPKPGDEYPEYIDASAPPIDLPPEEKLVSQQQLKRRSTAERSGSLSNKKKDGSDEVTSATLAKGEGGFWFEPDYSYAGNISPLQEEIEEELRLVAEQQAKEKAAAAQSSLGLEGSQPHISPYTSAGTTPLTGHSKPATGTPEESPGRSAAVQPTRQTPVGFVAELPSEITAKCREDTHPAPVELPGHHLAAGETRPAQYLDAFDIAPVELPAQSAPARGRAHNQSVSQQPVQPAAVPARQVPAPQHEARPSHPSRDVSSSSSVSSSTVGFQPYNANQRVVSEYDANRQSLVLNQYSVTDAQVGHSGEPSKRHTMEVTNLPVQPQEVPSALRPPLPPPKQPLNASGAGRPLDPPYLSKAIAGSRVPPVLQPARGRPHVPLDTSQRQTSPPKTYTPYSPLQDRRGSGLTAAEHILRAEHRHRSVPPESQQPHVSKQLPNSSHNSRPNVPPRTNTLPTHMPSIPFMPGEAKPASVPGLSPSSRPSHGPRAQSDYFVASQSTEIKHPSTEPPRKGEVDLSAYMNYSNPITPSDPNLPQPLKVSRPAVPNRVAELANTAPSVELPASSSSTQGTGYKRPDLPPKSSSDYGATNSAQDYVIPQQKPPEDRPSTAFSVVSNFSAVSESSVSSPPPQLSFRDRVAAKSPGPSTHRPDTQRVPSGSGAGQNFVVADPGLAVSPASTPSSYTSKARPPPSAVSSQQVSSGSIPTQQPFRNTETPPPNPQTQGPPSNHSQSPNYQTASPSAHRASVPGTPAGDYNRRHSTQSQSSVHSASSSLSQPLVAQRPRQPPGAPQVLAGQTPRPPSVSSSIHSSSSQNQASSSSPYDQHPQGPPAPNGFQLPGTSPYHAMQGQQTSGGHMQPSAGWQPQVPQYAQRPSNSIVPRETDAARPPLRPHKEPLASQPAHMNNSNAEAGRRHSASVGQSMAPHAGQTYVLATTQGGHQYPPRPESVPVGISHHPTQSQPTLHTQGWIAPRAQPGKTPQGRVPQLGQPGMLVHPQVQGLRPNVAFQQPGSAAGVEVGRTATAQQAIPPQADASGKEKRRNKLQKAGGPGPTQSSTVAVQPAPSQVPSKQNPVAQSNATSNSPQSQPSATQVRTSQPATTTAYPMSSQQPQTPSFTAPSQQPSSVQGAQRPLQSQRPAQAMHTQQRPQQPAWVIQSQPYSTAVPYAHPGQTPYQVPVYQMTYQVPAGGQQMQQNAQRPPPSQEDRRESHPAQAAPTRLTNVGAQQSTPSNKQSTLPNQYAQGSQPRPLQQRQPSEQELAQQKALQQLPQQEQYQQKPLQQQQHQQQWAAHTGGQLAWSSGVQAMKPGPTQPISQPAALQNASDRGGMAKDTTSQPPAHQPGQHRQSVGQVQSTPPATKLPHQNVQHRTTMTEYSAPLDTSTPRKHDQSSPAKPQPAEAKSQPLRTQAESVQPQTPMSQPSSNTQKALVDASPAQRPETQRQKQFGLAQHPNAQGPSSQQPSIKQTENPYEQHRLVPGSSQNSQSPPRQRFEPAPGPASRMSQVQSESPLNQPRYRQPASQQMNQQQAIQNQPAVASNGGLVQTQLTQPGRGQPQPQPQPPQPAMPKTEPTKPKEPLEAQQNAETSWFSWAKDKVTPLQDQTQAAPPQVQPQAQPQPRPQVQELDKSQNKAASNFAILTSTNKPSSAETGTGTSTQGNTSSTQPAKATAGGWGDASGYDGSGWGDEDDEYY